MDAGVLSGRAAASGVVGRARLRYVAAALALAIAALYVLIALQVVTVASTEGKDSPFVPMAGAAAAFILGAVLLLTVDRLLVYLLGAVVQIVVIVGYFAVSPSRTPHFEAWGLCVKVAQVALLLLLLYLGVRSSSARAGGRAGVSR